jgi:hypothetical protein
MIQLSFSSGPPMIAATDEVVRVLLPGDRFERRRAGELVVGDIVQARGRIRAITSFEAARRNQLVRKSA